MTKLVQCDKKEIFNKNYALNYPVQYEHAEW